MKKVGLKNDGHFEKVYSQKMVQKLSLGFLYRDQYGPFRYKHVEKVCCENILQGLGYDYHHCFIFMVNLWDVKKKKKIWHDLKKKKKKKSII